MGVDDAQRNLGVTEVYPHAPSIDTVGDAIVMPERMLKALISDSIAKLIADEDERRRYFSFFFDASVSEQEREDYVRDFVLKPPVVTMGYPRKLAEFPAVAIIAESENESQRLLGQVMRGPSDNEVEAQDIVGAIYENVYAIWILAEHPDQMLYLYHLIKSTIISGQQALMEAGVIEVGGMSAADVLPAPEYASTNMYQRVLKVPMTVPTSAPRVYPFDPSRFRVTGIFRDDVVVDGMPGGVATYAPGEE